MMLYRIHACYITQVLAVTSDGSVVNHCLIKLHGQSDKDLIYKQPCPFTADNQDIFLTLHIWSAKNCLVSNHRQLWLIKEHP